jgi:hypothetical protein
MNSTREIGVVHLVRAQNGVEPFRCFLESYRQNDGGIEHDLIVVLKGFDEAQSNKEYLKLLKDFKHTYIEVPDIGYDITAYFAAFRHYAKQYRYFCFLNSFSVLQDKNWLQQFHEYISQSNVGLVGATGSWQSHIYKKMSWFKVFIKVGIDHFQLYKDKIYWKRVVLGIVGSWNHVLFLVNCKPFPNFHIRTNAFMISAKLLQQIHLPTIKNKIDAYKFESGRNGLTTQVLMLKKKVLVVGKDGKGYEMQLWNESKTFWQSEQENLLVADNQTRDYQFGSIERRRYLSCMAWKMGCDNSNIGARQ